VKVYGNSDAVITFLGRLNSHFKVIKLESFDHYKEFSKTPEKELQRIDDETYQEIVQIENELAQVNATIKSIHDDLKDIQNTLNKKYFTVKKVYGELKEKIQDEIDDLKLDKEKIENDILDMKSDQHDLDEDLKLAKQDRERDVNGAKEDINKYGRLKESKDFKVFLQGAYGEHKVIEHLIETLDNKDYHLINAWPD